MALFRAAQVRCGLMGWKMGQPRKGLHDHLGGMPARAAVSQAIGHCDQHRVVPQRLYDKTIFVGGALQPCIRDAEKGSGLGSVFNRRPCWMI